MKPENLAGIFAAANEIESMHSKFMKSMDALLKIAENDIIVLMEQGEDYQVHRAALGARKISTAINEFVGRAKPVHDAFSAAIMYFKAAENAEKGLQPLFGEGEGEGEGEGAEELL